MNTPVSFEIAKLLKENGFDKPCGQFYAERILDDDEVIRDNLCQRRDFGIYAIQITNYNLSYEYAREQVNEGCYSAPTIAEVVMWLYEKHGIWISLDWMTRIKPYNSGFICHIRGTNKKLNSDNFIVINDTLHPGYEVFNSPKEAYSVAIEYTLKNLI